MKPVFGMHWIHENAFQLESTSTGTDVTDLKDATLLSLFVTLFPDLIDFILNIFAA